MHARAIVLVLLVSAMLGLPAPPASAASDINTLLDLTFPVAGDDYHYSDTYWAARGSSREHKGTDIMAPGGTPVHAAVGGTISWITGLNGSPPSYGYMVTIRGDDGNEHSYVHLGTQDGPPSAAYGPGMGKGVRVERGQLIGYVGCSGNASCAGPHLHYDIEDPSYAAQDDDYDHFRYNPYPSLRDAEARGDLPGATNGLPLAGDWDGDGIDTPGWYREGRVTLRNSETSGPADVRFTYGRAGDIPIVGDWNGDGIDTLGIVRSGGEWHLINSHRSGSSDIKFTYGRVGSRGEDLPLVGDWNGDGRDTVGIVRDGEWHLRNTLSSGRGQIVFTYGRIGPRGDDLPLVGDWNGDGHDTVGIVRDGDWHLRNATASGPGDIVFRYGRVTRGDMPVTGAWDSSGVGIGIVRDNSWHLRTDLSGGPATHLLNFTGL